MMPGAGLEPARSCEQRILSPLCLPIPPPGLETCKTFQTSLMFIYNYGFSGYVFANMISSFFYSFFLFSSCLWFQSKKTTTEYDVKIQWFYFGGDSKSDKDDLKEFIGDKPEKVKTTPDQIQMMGELSQLRLILGVYEEDDHQLLQARDYGLNCLRSNSGFKSLLKSAGGKIRRRSMNALESTPQMIACSIWTVVAWSKWLYLRNAHSSSLDMKSIIAMTSWIEAKTSNITEQGEIDLGWLGYSKALGQTLSNRISKTTWKKIEDNFQLALSRSNNNYWAMDYIEYVLIRQEKWDLAKQKLAQIEIEAKGSPLYKRKSHLEKIISR